jgi:hypothetical protein
MKTRIFGALKGTVIGLMGVALLAIAGGCGDMDRSPMATDTGVQAETAALETGGKLVFSTRALMTSLAKRSGPGKTTKAKKTSSRFRPKLGGDLSLTFPKYGDDSILRVKKAHFKVKKNSIGGLKPNSGNRYKISMEVTTGTTLDDIVISFTPSGLKFRPAARLKLLLKGRMDVGGAAKLAGAGNEDADMSEDRDEGEEAFMYHVSKNGEISKVLVQVKEKKSGWLLTIRVPGFSEYNWDDGAEANGPRQW